jgi:hypothetical protein
MSTWNLTDDEILLSLLGSVIDEADPVPDAAVLMAKAAARIDSLDAELAALVADSLLDEEALLVRRDLSEERLVTFASSRFSLDIELPAEGGTLFGVVSPSEAIEVEIETTGGDPQTVRSDPLGRFHVEVGRGPCRLRVGSGDEAFVTPWIMR